MRKAGGMWGSQVVKIAATLLLPIGGLVCWRALGPHVSHRELSAWLSQFGDFAPLMFLAFLTARPLTLLPTQLLAAVG